MSSWKKRVSILLSLNIVIFQISSLVVLVCVSNFGALIGNIQIPSGYLYLNLDTSQPENLYGELPYTIKNEGAYFLSEVNLQIQGRVNYINFTNKANITSHVFTANKTLDDCPPFSTYQGIFVIEYYEFNYSSIVEMQTNFDLEEDLFFRIDFVFSGRYFFNLIYFKISQEEVEDL